MELVEKHGVLVRPGKIAVSDFLRKVSRRDSQRFCGTMRALRNLAKRHFDDFEPGTGSVDGDVRLVRVPASGFRTNIVPIAPENEHLVELVYRARVEGEVEVPQKVIFTDEPHPSAAVVKLVLYRADVLAKDDDRSSDAEWEIVSINAQPEEDTPMHPETMKRNAANAEGGTLRHYTDEEWARSIEYWDRHALLKPKESE